MADIAGMIVCAAWGVNLVFVLGLHSKSNEYEHYSVIKGGLFFGFTFGLLSMTLFNKLLEIITPQIMRWWYGLTFEKGPIVFAVILVAMICAISWTIHKPLLRGKDMEGE